ncbi:c-type cytochrome [Algihabitans albus]|uniref:c-type cytochrome n=1 Tax=Algihabitans albus TaxID=2164067 RepID=UPI000E5D6FD9|nr:cytochrome c [Algihabitans albus]
MSVSVKRPLAAAAAATILLAGAGAFAEDPPLFGLGTPATPEQIAAWDIDIRPDGQGLPPGSGSAEAGETIYAEQCAFCHGDFGEGMGRYPVLMGGFDSLTAERPEKTVGSYWPYASTVWDYIYRAMPFGNAQSLGIDDTYAVTAYVLYLNEIVEYDQMIDQSNLADIEMPNAGGFFLMEGPEFERYEPCMENCRDSVEITGKARVLDVTPDDGGQTAIE